MPEHEREARQIALLDDYERILAADQAATPPPDLDPGLATVARRLERELGGAQPTRAATPDEAFKAALRQRLAEQAAAQTRPAVPPAMPLARLPGVTYRDRHIPSTPPLPPPTVSPNGKTGRRNAAASPRTAHGTPPTARPRPLRAAFATGAGWLGAALVILIALVAATLLLRGLPRSTPAVQPNTTPSPVQVPTAPIPTSALNTATPPPAATPTPIAPLWQPTGAMDIPRSQHSATRLADGRVLVTGGYGNSGDGESSAELYDPRTGRWTTTAAMGVGRIAHTALLLPDGQVLVAGGFNNSVNHNTTSVTGAERYDPATGQWHATAAPPVGLGGVNAALLADGRVLIITSSPVGTPPEQQAFTALLYDPRADSWTPLGALDLPGLSSVVALLDGRALLLSAAQVGDAVAVGLLLDPATGRTMPAPLPDARGGFSANLLSDGRVLVTGGSRFEKQDGRVTNTIFLDSTIIFNPSTGQWSAAASLETARTGHTAIVLSDGRLLAVGGNNPTGGAQPTTAELYDPQTNRWIAVGALTTNARAYFAVAPLPNGRAIVTGGDAGFVRSQYLAFVDLFTPPARQAAPASPPSPTPTPTASPALTLTPNQAPCGTPITARGAGFPIGRTVEISASGSVKPTGAPPLTATVAPDGTFSLDLAPCASPAAAQEGTQYAVAAIVPNPDPLAPSDAAAQAVYTVGPTAQRPLPTLTLASEAGACDTPVVASGANWFPGDRLSVTAFQVGQHSGVGFAEVTVSPDGTFTLPFSMDQATLCSVQDAPPLGTQYRITVGPNVKANSPRLDYASAIYTITRERTAAPASPPPATPTPTPSFGIVDWNSPSAGLLFHDGRGYRLRTLTLTDGTAPGIDQQIDTTVLRLQSGGVFQAGTPIYSVAGQSPDEWLALKDGDRIVTYLRDDSATVLLAGMQVVWGTVQDAGTMVCPAYGCPSTPEQQQPGTIATAYRVRVDRILQGSLPAGATINVRQMGTFTSPVPSGSFAPLQPSDTVLLFLQPAQQQSIGDFGGGEYYWTTTGWIYHVVQGVIDPIGRSPDDFYGPPDRFEAAIAALFSNVTPLAPTDPRPTPPPVPTATRVAPTALPVATPTPPPRP